MTSFKDIISFLRKIFKDHNDVLNTASHVNGFNHPLLVFQQGIARQGVTIDGTYGTSTTYPINEEAKLNLFSKGSDGRGNCGAIAYLRMKDSNNYAKYVPIAVIDVDQSAATIDNVSYTRTQMEFHMYDATGVVLDNAPFMIRTDVPASGTATAENTYVQLYKYDPTKPGYVALATKNDVANVGFPVVDYAKMETWTGQTSSKTVTKNGIVRCWQARYNGYLRVNGKNVGSVSDAAQHNAYAIVAPGDEVSWKAHASGNVWFYPFKTN